MLACGVGCGVMLATWPEAVHNLKRKLKASIQTHSIKQASTSVFLLYCASLYAQTIVMILCVMRGPDSTSRAQSNSRP